MSAKASLPLPQRIYCLGKEAEENIVGKRKWWLPAFSLFPTMFSKGYFRVAKTWWIGRVNPFPNKPLFLCVCNTNLSKTLLKHEKLQANFTFYEKDECPNTISK